MENVEILSFISVSFGFVPAAIRKYTKLTPEQKTIAAILKDYFGKKKNRKHK